MWNKFKNKIKQISYLLPPCFLILISLIKESKKDTTKISVFVVSIVFILLYFLIAYIIQKKSDQKIQLLTEKSIEKWPYLKTVFENLELPKGEVYCPKTGFLCSAQKIIESDYRSEIIAKLELTDDDCKKYNLIKDSDFDKKESEFFVHHKSGEIWIISHALETEIKTPEEFKTHPDDSLKKSMEVVAQNIEKGGHYVQFVSLGPQGENDVTYQNRCRIYWATPKGIEKAKMPIIRIDDNDGLRSRENDPDYEYLVKLTSTILFVDDSQDKLFVDGYFCLRPDDSETAKEYERRTVFFKAH